MSRRRKARSAALACAVPWLVACQSAVQSYFADHGYRYPVHVERDTRPERYCIPKDYHPQVVQELALLSDRAADALARAVCPRATAVALRAPFVADVDHPWYAPAKLPKRLQLAMKIECYGQGPPLANTSIAEAQGDIARDPKVHKALDAWPLEAVDDGRAWYIWNVALFRREADRVVFSRLLRHWSPSWDPMAQRNAQIGPVPTSYWDFSERYGRCGEPIVGGTTEGNTARAL